MSAWVSWRSASATRVRCAPWLQPAKVPMVVVDAMRVGPISGITGAPGQGEFYVARYCTHGGNFETIVLSPSS